MKNDSLITRLLMEHFPTECEAVGPTNVQDIVDGEIQFAPAEHGSYMDFGEYILILVAAVGFISNALQIYAILKDELQREPSAHEFEILVITDLDNAQGLDEVTRKRLIDGIIRNLGGKENGA